VELFFDRRISGMRDRGDVHQLMAALWKTNAQKPYAFRSLLHSAAVNASIRTDTILNAFAVLGEDAFRLLKPYLLDRNWRKLAGYVLARTCETALPNALAMSRRERAEMQEAGLVCLYYLAKIRDEPKALDEIRRQRKRGSVKSVRMTATSMDEALDRFVQSRVRLEQLARNEYPDPLEQSKAIQQYMDWQMLKDATKPWPSRTPPRPDLRAAEEQS